MISFYATVLALVLGSLMLVWAGCTLYFRYRQAQFWANVEADAKAPMTEDERAEAADWAVTAGDGIDNEADFLDRIYDELEPEGDTKAAPPATAQEALLDNRVAAKAQLDRERRQGDAEIPVGEIFDGGDGFKYKYVLSPVDCRRVKMKVSGAVTNAAAIPMPTAKEMSRVMAKSAAETVYGLDPTFNLDATDDRCELCDVSESHSHTGTELRDFINTRVEASFKKQIDDMDLTRLSMEEVERLWARCRAVIEENATLAALARLDKIWYRVTQFDEEDEAFFHETCAEAAKGPVPLEMLERSPEPVPAADTVVLSRADADEILNQLKLFKLAGAGALSNPCNCSKCISEELKEGETMLLVEQAEEAFSDEEDGEDEPESARQKKAVTNAAAIPMPKKYMSGIMRQTAEDSLMPSLELLVDDLFEDGTPEGLKEALTKEEERNHRGAIGVSLGKMVEWYAAGKPKIAGIVEGPIDKIKLIPARKKAPKKGKAKPKAGKKK